MNGRYLSSLVLSVLLVVILGLAGVTAPQVRAQSNETENGWFVDSVGTYFEITNSEYLNITLTSTETVYVLLVSIPRVVSLHIESNSPTTSTILTFTGFQPDTTYYRYQDGELVEEFATDPNGGYTYTQDISEPHYVTIQDEKATIYIKPDGTVDPSTAPISVVGNVYTFTDNISEPITVQCDNIVIDGAGYTLQGTGTDFGISLTNRKNVTIKDVKVKGWAYGIRLYYSWGNTISGNDITNAVFGISLYASSGNSISGNDITNGSTGIDLFYYCLNNIISGNNITGTAHAGINVWFSIYYTSWRSNNIISLNNITDSKKYGIHLTHWASYNTISENNIIGNGERGIRVAGSSNNTISVNNIKNNDREGIWIGSAGPPSKMIALDNLVYHNNIIGNAISFLHRQAGDNNYLYGYPPNHWHHPDLLEGNYWSDYPGADDGSGSDKHAIAGDGIGDTDIPWYRDYYPFTQESGWIVNLPPVADANGPYTGYEGSLITFDGIASHDPDGIIVGYEWDLDEDGEHDDATGVNATYTWSDDYYGNVSLKVTDDKGATGTDTTTVTVLNVAPTVGPITGVPAEPVKVGTSINAGATFTDPGTLDTHTAEWNWGDETLPDTVYGATSPVSGSHMYTAPGVYTVTLTITDKDDGIGSAQFQYVVVYDPEGGFVTGGGWINSPAGAYTADDTLTGKATFGFVSKYKKGADVPSGETQFRFRVADLNFHSTSYEWLVIAGHKAQFKGEGTINGAGNYGFILTAIDEKLTPSTDVDMFRIKIWDKDTDSLVYDNKIDSADDADGTLPIGGGSIVIHVK